MSSLPLPLAAFVAGLISFLSPCVLPLVPGYVSLISGAGVDELQAQNSAMRRTVLLNSMMFILGFSVVFIAMGASATALGSLAGEHRSLLIKIGGVIILLFGLHMTGILPIKALYADKRLHNLKGGASVVGAFLIGFSFAFGWTPCVGPILGLILGIAATENAVVRGMILLGVYSLGLAVPFLLTSLAIGKFLGFYGRFRQHLHKVEVGSGILMMALGILVISGHFLKINTWLNHLPLFRSLTEKFL